MFKSLMSENFESGVAQQLEGLQSLPWRKYTAVMAVSFIAATLASITAGYFLLGKDKPMASAGNRIDMGDTQGFVLPGVTLNQVGIDLILKRNIFNAEGSLGDDTGSGPVARDKTNVIIKSDLPLTLVGTIYGGTPYNGVAVIESTQKEKKVNTFQVGDLLLKEATLVEIYPDKAIVERLNGQREYLLLKHEEQKQDRRRQKGQKQVASNPISTGAGGYATTPPPETFKEDGFDRKGNEIQMNEAYRDRLLSVDFAKVLQDAKATPNIVDNQLKGFILTKIRKDSVYEKSGFMDGDVIEEINGVSLTDTAQTIKFLNTLRGEKEIEVRFRRGGQVQNKTLNVR